MRFLFWQTREKISSPKARSLDGIFQVHKKKILDLNKHYWVVRIDKDFFKGFFIKHHRLMSLVGVFLIVTILGSFSGFARADVATFYPSTCLGGWEHPENAEGEPSLSAGADASLFTLENSTHMQSSSDALYCGGFKGNIPENTKPTHFRISLSLSVDDGSVNHRGPASVDDATLSPTLDTTKPDDTQPDITTMPSNIAPAPIDAPAQDVPAPDTTPVPDNTPQSFLYNLFGTTVFAEDNTTPAAVVEPTDSAPPSALSDKFLEVDYTLDGTDWNVLGDISRSSWQNNSFDIPLTEWTNLDNLQISVKPLATFDDPSVVYLDNMALSVDYDNIQNLVEPPTVILKDSASVISGDKTDFSSNEQPTFTVTNPNIDTNGIKDLIDQNKAEVVSDPDGTLGEPSLPPPAVDISNDGLKQTIDSVDKIVAPTDNSPSSFNFFGVKTVYAADFSTSPNNISASVLDTTGNTTDISATVENVVVDGVTEQQVKIKKPSREFRPGRYRLKISMATSQATIISEQDFTWGVLAVNLSKSVYQVGDDAFLQMGVLNDQGRTLCDANLSLEILSPSGDVTNLSTKDKSIIADKQCGPNNVISVPDYYAHFQIPNDIGTYKITLTANTTNGAKSITDSFDVETDTPFTIERTGPTRIYPVADYPMTLQVTAKDDWQGTIIEKVPASFEVLEPDTATTYDSVNTAGDTKIISWNVSLVAGEEQTLGYNFNAPDISPEFYLLGPAQFVDANNNISFIETRNWQIASDSICTLTNSAGSWTWDGTANVAQSGHGTATWTGCSSTPGFTPSVGDTIQIGSGQILNITGTASVGAITLATPTVSNGLIISDGITVTVSGALTFQTLSTAVNETVTLGTSTGAGNLTVGSIINTAPTGAVADNQKIICGNASNTGTLLVSGAGTTSFTSSSTASNTGTSGIDLSAGLCKFTTGTGATSIIGGTAGTALLKMGAANLTLNGNLTMSGTAAKAQFTTTNNGTITIGAASTIANAGTLSIASTTNLTVNANMTWAHATTVTTWGTCSFTAGSSSFSAAAQTCNSLSISDGATLTLAGFAFTVNTTTTIGSGGSGGSLLCPSAATCAGLKTFTGNITVNTNSTLNLTTSSTVATVSIGGATYTANGTTFNTGTGAITITGTGALSFAGTGAMTWGGTMTVPTNRVLSNDKSTSGTLTIGALTFATAPAAAISFSLATGSTTTVIGAITFAVGASAVNESILMNGNANLNAASISMPAPTATGSALITCVSSCTGTLTTTGAVTITGNSTSTGVSTIAMDTGNVSIGGLLTVAGGSLTAATFSKSTGNLTLSGGITFSGTSANAKLTITGVNQTISFAGTWTNTVAPTLTIDPSTTLKTINTATLFNTTGITWPGNLWVSLGTTTLSALASTISGTTEITGTLANTTGTTLKTFTKAFTVDSGGTVSLNTGTPTTSFGAGIVQNSSNAMMLGGGSTIAAGDLSGTGTGGITFSSTLAITGTTNNSYSGGTVTVTGVLSGSTFVQNNATAKLSINATPTITTLTANFVGNLVTYTGGTMKASSAHYYDLTTTGTVTAVADTVDHNLIVSSGTFATGAVAFTVSGTTSISGAVTNASGAVAKTFTGTVTVNSGGSLNLATSIAPTTSFGAGIVQNSSTLISLGGAATLSGNLSGTGTGGITFGSTLGINGSQTTTNNYGAGTTTVAGVLTLTGGWTQGSNSPTLSYGSATILGNGGGGTFDASTNPNTVIYSATSANCKVVNYSSLTISGSGTFACATVSSIGGNLTMSGSETWTTGANLVVAGTTNIGNGTTLILGAFTFESDGNMAVGGVTNGTFTATNSTGITLKGNLLINAGGIWNKPSGGAVNVTFTNSSPKTITDNTATCFATVTTCQELGNVITVAPASVSTATNIEVTSLNIANSTTFSIATDTISINGTGTPLTVGGTATFGVATSTVQYSAATATVAATTFNNLILGGTGTYTMPVSNITLLGNLSITSTATYIKGAGTIIFTIGGGGTQTVTDNEATKHDLGNIQISANSGNSNLALGSNILATNITIDPSQVLDVTTAPYNITLNGNWTNNGGTSGFNSRTGTVTLATNSTANISGATIFNNFSVSGIGAAKILNFTHQVGNVPIFTFNGTVTLNGASGQLITINSDLSGTQWLAHFNSAPSATFVSVKDSGCDSGSLQVTTDVHSILGTDNGFCWTPSITFSNSDSSIGFGTLSNSFVTYANGTANGSITDIVAHRLTVSTSAINGYTLSYIGPTLTYGSSTILACTVPVGTGGTAGQSQFAISGTLTGTETGAMRSVYDHNIPNWSYIPGTTSTLASSTGPVSSDAIDMHYEANISPATPAGAYATTITYLLTGNF
jgi:hypothetical protein